MPSVYCDAESSKPKKLETYNLDSTKYKAVEVVADFDFVEQYWIVRLYNVIKNTSKIKITEDSIINIKADSRSCELWKQNRFIYLRTNENGELSIYCPDENSETWEKYFRTAKGRVMID